MAGALIPDDWDGSTYKCWKVQWPDSLDYSAILLGNISKPSFLDYWDADTGDAQEAADAIKTAYKTTLPDFWAGDCDPVTLTTRSFRVSRDANQSIPASTWTKVLFNEFVWNYETPGWNLAENAQDLTIPANAGIWQYNGEIHLNTSALSYLAIRLNNYSDIAVIRVASGGTLMINGVWDVNATWTWLNLWVWSNVANEIRSQDNFTPWFEGHLVTSVEEA